MRWRRAIQYHASACFRLPVIDKMVTNHEAVHNEVAMKDFQQLKVWERASPGLDGISHHGTIST